uniref:transcriptional regulator FilR1 domain-containing protein n=1 Tax=Halegenticoccus soli TaxID=1985678 RepID=UPI001E5C08F4|nr:hypothetical protein [Halegenticoccus soli]
MVFEDYERLASTVTDTSRFQQFLAHGGEIARRLRPESLVDLTVTTATADNPHAPIDRYLTVLGDSPVTSFRGMAPIVSRVFNEAAEAVIGPETSMELIIDEAVLNASEARYPDALAKAFDLPQFELLLSPDEIDFGLALIDGRAFVGAYDEHGNLIASVDGTGDALWDLSTEVYAEYRERARSLERADVTARH